MIYVFGYLVTVVLAMLGMSKIVSLENMQTDSERKTEYASYVVALIIAGLGWPIVGLGFLIKLLVVRHDRL